MVIGNNMQIKVGKIFFGKGFNHPWWTLGHVSVKRDVYLQVLQREAPRSTFIEDSAFVADLLLRGFQVGAIENQLTGYCKF